MFLEELLIMNPLDQSLWNQLFKYNNVAIACAYFNYKEEGTQSPEGLTANVLKQLLQNDIDVPRELRTL